MNYIILCRPITKLICENVSGGLSFGSTRKWLTIKTNYRSLSGLGNNMLQLKRFNVKNSNNINRKFYLTNQNYYRPGRQHRPRETPKIIYTPKFFRWLKAKWKFKLLKVLWDPEFSEGAFIYGTKQAICFITDRIHFNDLEQYDGLLTKKAKTKLLYDIDNVFTSTQKRVIQIQPEDIKIMVPVFVHLLRRDKVCKAGVRILALKWHPERSNIYKLVLVVIQAEFLRDYKPIPPSDWIISGYNVLECNILI